MANRQQKSNKETKKPKKDKTAAAAPKSFERGLTEAGSAPKKTGK